MYASQDYSNKAQGGLSFKSGDTVYVLLRNGGGWCTGKLYTTGNVILPEFKAFKKLVRCNISLR